MDLSDLGAISVIPNVCEFTWAVWLEAILR